MPDTVPEKRTLPPPPGGGMLLPGFRYDGAEITLEPLPGGKRRIRVRALDGGHVERGSIDTSYPDALIRLLLQIKGAAYLCDEISRDEDPSYVEGPLSVDLDAFGIPRSRLAKARILDYGCGCGASSTALARMFPKAEIVGVELDQRFAEAARALVAHRGYARVAIHVSPSGTDVPPGLGEFDAVLMGGVFEHLLPEERRTLMPKIWRTLKHGGFLLLNETPHRWWVVETHTTGIPFLNYLPDALALRAAHLSPRYARPESWSTLLRHGIRGASEAEVLESLDDPSARPLAPLAGDAIDMWYAQLGPRARVVKRMVRAGLKGIKAVTGVSCVPFISMVVERP
jgi:2-polyprenyl-3-methyl-5-hydroxy-6-metoxy-1,4-benzoquinol methylase